MKCIILCAGSGKRYLKEYPKQLELIFDEPNYMRTIRLLNENGVSDVWLSVSDQNTEWFTYPHKFVGSDVREIDRFRNIEQFITEPSLILYGDVVYYYKDLQRILANCNRDVFFGRLTGNSYTHKPYGEIMGVFINTPSTFFKAVHSVAEKFEKGLLGREITWEVLHELNYVEKSIIILSIYTDDYDSVEEYRAIKKVYDTMLTKETS